MLVIGITTEKSERQDLNLRPRAPHARALPSNYPLK